MFLLIGIFGTTGHGEEIGGRPSRLDDSGDGEGAFGRLGVDVGGAAAGSNTAGPETAPARCGFQIERKVGREGGMDDLVGFGGGGAYAGEDEFALCGDGFGYAGEVDGGVDVAFHDGAAVVVFDEALVAGFGHLDGLGKSLLLEIPNRIIIRISNKILNPLRNRMHLQQIHQLRPIPLHLLTRAHGTKGDLGKSHFLVGPVAYPPDDFLVGIPSIGIVGKQREGLVTTIEHQAGDVLLGHFGELLREEGFEADESDEVLAGAVVDDYGAADGIVGVGWFGWWCFFGGGGGVGVGVGGDGGFFFVVDGGACSVVVVSVIFRFHFQFCRRIGLGGDFFVFLLLLFCERCLRYCGRYFLRLRLHFIGRGCGGRSGGDAAVAAPAP
mmetsp:Transcript_28799/g.60800  ORF Transcript_28799/g.60800 Transcript_28799/m.60800 type:complete len:382 (+) Transcript_28799:249-1394(+)